MKASQLRQMFKRFCKQTVTIRRYAGTGDEKADYQGRGNARLYSTDELSGNITQGDQRVVVLTDGLVAAGFALPLLSSDKVVVDSFEREILAFGEAKALEGELIAYTIQARG